MSAISELFSAKFGLAAPASGFHFDRSDGL